MILGLMGLIIIGFTKANKHEISHCCKANLFIFVGSSFCRILYQKQVYFFYQSSLIGRSFKTCEHFPLS